MGVPKVVASRGRVVNTFASYSVAPGFESRRPAVPIEVFRSFTQFLQANVGIVP
jgi:hypothetical protein